MKNCTVCGVELTSENQKPYHKKNYVHKCIECVRAYGREVSKKKYGKEQASLSKKNWDRLKKDDPKRYTVRQMISSSGKRAKQKGLEHNLTTEYLLTLTNKTCPILGTELSYGGKGLPNSASLDRVDSSKGYVEGNVWIISNLANTMKSNATVEELIKFGEWCNSLKGTEDE